MTDTLFPKSNNQTDRLDLSKPIDEQVEEQVRRIMAKTDCHFKLHVVKRKCKPVHISIQAVSHGTEINGN